MDRFVTPKTMGEKKLMKKKQRHQVKSRFYYIFWGAATISVFAGQMYVGTGYRSMSESINRLVDQIETPRFY
jgi:hypothetical protein